MEQTGKNIDRVYNLLSAYKNGELSGEKMPEDENPRLQRSSKENYMYFTLPMALNYQRNSYVLWKCANRMYHDEKAKKVFDSKSVLNMEEEVLRKYLVNYKVALQPNKPLFGKLCVRLLKLNLTEIFAVCLNLTVIQ